MTIGKLLFKYNYIMSTLLDLKVNLKSLSCPLVSWCFVGIFFGGGVQVTYIDARKITLATDRIVGSEKIKSRKLL